MVPGISAFSKSVDVVLTQERHSRLCGHIQTTESEEITDIDVA